MWRLLFVILACTFASLGFCCGGIGIAGYPENSTSAGPCLLIGIFLLAIGIFLKPSTSPPPPP